MTIHFVLEFDPIGLDGVPGAEVQGRMAQCMPDFGRLMMYELRRVFGLVSECRGQSNVLRRNAIDISVLGDAPEAAARVPAANRASWATGRERLRSFINSGEEIWMRINSVLGGPSGRQPMIAYETVASNTTTQMYMNPFTWFLVAGSSVRPALQASSPRAAMSMGPAMLLLHETGHMSGFGCMRPAPGRVCAVLAGTRDSLGNANPEAYINEDVDAVTAGHPDVIPRGIYRQGFAGQQYPVGTGGEWVRWPTAQQLRSGQQ